MDLVSTEHGQAFQQFYAEEVRPLSGTYLPDLLRTIVERYAFTAVPTLDQAATEGAKFKTGRLIQGSHLIEIKDLGVFSDGVLAVCWNTDDAKIILDDLIMLAKNTFGFRHAITNFPIRFVSSVVVEFNESLDHALRMFQELRHDLERLVHNAYGLSAEIVASRVTLASDPTTLPPHTTVDFTIERRAGMPFSLNRYFSSAPLSTTSHLELLASLEKRIATERRN